MLRLPRLIAATLDADACCLRFIAADMIQNIFHATRHVFIAMLRLRCHFRYGYRLRRLLHAAAAMLFAAMIFFRHDATVAPCHTLIRCPG